VVEWRIEYFREPSGRVPVQEFIDRLRTEEQIETMVASICCEPIACHLGDRGWRRSENSLWELRIRSRRQLRVLYFAHTGKTFVLLHAFVKKTRQVPQAEIETATRRMKQYLRR
jgi:phage-related protein